MGRVSGGRKLKTDKGEDGGLRIDGGGGGGYMPDEGIRYWNMHRPQVNATQITQA